MGEEKDAKRIDVLAVALGHETTVEELLNIDLSYAPRVLRCGTQS